MAALLERCAVLCAPFRSRAGVYLSACAGGACVYTGRAVPWVQTPAFDMPKMVTREKSDYGRKVQEKAVIEKVAPSFAPPL